MTTELKFKRKLSPELKVRKREIALKNLEKARKEGKLGKHGKTKYTLLKENIEKDLRDKFISDNLKHFERIVKQMVAQALGGDGKMQQYIINQLIGRPKETVEQTGSPENLKTIEATVREIANRQD